jgi:hypothetical protein
MALLASFGIFFLLTTIARELGKRREEELFAKWGGKPTTQILRHRNDAIDHITKTRYHSFLSKALDVPFPTPQSELADQVSADARYSSGARWLLDQTRDTVKFSLLYKELVAYGFRRNCLGLKPIAIVICIVAQIWLFTAAGVIGMSGFDGPALLTLPMSARVVTAINVVLLLTWILFVSKRTVRTSAFMYADLLVRACDALA